MGMVAHVAVTPNMMWWGVGTEKRASCIIKKSAAISNIYTVDWPDQTIAQIYTRAAVHTDAHSLGLNIVA